MHIAGAQQTCYGRHGGSRWWSKIPSAWAANVAGQYR